MSKNPLSKNFVYKDKPRNELEGLLANMHGENYPVEAKNGLIKEVSKLTPGSALDNRFIVTLTPRGQAAFNGTMDKTVAEIREAWNAGKSIFFRINIGDNTVTVQVTIATDTLFMAYAIYDIADGAFLMELVTDDDPTSTNYNVYGYVLNRAY